jgi:hypothetical protein
MIAMKGYLFGLIGLVVLGSAPVLGQSPYMTGTPLVGDPTIGSPYVGRGRGYTGSGATIAGGGPIGVAPASSGLGSHASASCCKRGDYICVPEQFMRRTPKTIYRCGCEPICVDYPYGFFRKCSCDGGAPPRIRKFLIKAVHTTEAPCVRCIPAPACAGGACGAPACAGGACCPQP